MATTTATITLTSADLTGDALSLSTTATLTKHNSDTGLDYTTGVNRITYGSAQTNTNLIAAADYNDTTRAHKVYIKNLSTSNSDSLTIEFGGSNTVVGKLYGGDWAFLPYDGTNDIDVSTSGALSVEYMVIYQQ
jgi:hypothetical protein